MPLNAAGQDVVMLEELRTGPAIEPLHPDESAIAMYQLTSGSTGTPKAVQLTHANILANSNALFTATDGDASHRRDGQLASAVARHGHTRVPRAADAVRRRARRSRPEEFLRRPALWADLIGRYRGTITSGPNFAYALLALTLERAEPGRFDLSSLRVAINGAEPIDARDTSRLAQAGARSDCVPGRSPRRTGWPRPRWRSPSTTRHRSTSTGSVAAICRNAHWPRRTPERTRAGWSRSVSRWQAWRFASSTIDPGRVRRVTSGRSRFAVRRCPADTSPSTGGCEGAIRDGWLHTGDLGYFDEHGRLYVCGRTKDVIVIAGNNIYPTDVERAACAVPGVRAGNAVAVRIDAGQFREGFAVLAESKLATDPVEAERIRAEIALRVNQAVGHNARAVLVLPPGGVPKTGSGKLQRRKAAEMFARLRGRGGAGMSAPPAIQLERLRIVRGGNTVLDDVTVSVSEGIITGLLGPSGCGKTTLMRTVVGNQKITAGTATVLGHAAGAKSLRRRIGYVTQSPSIYRDLTTVENVRYFAALYGIGNQRVHEVVEAVGLTGQKTDLAGNLSGGQQGRVSLACALVCDPDLLILDEPTVGLDPLLRVELWERFVDMADRGKTLLISSHAMDEARQCAELILMRDGAILAHAEPEAILRQTNCSDLEAAFVALVRSELRPVEEARS